MTRLKTLFPIIVLSLIISCTSQIEKSTSNKKTNSLVQFDKSRIIGDWKIHGALLNDGIFSSSFKPSINFKENKLAILTYPNNRKESYKWNIVSNKIELTCEEIDVIEQYFENREYDLEFTQKEKFIELKMHLPNGRGFILRK